jgi:hypothetical protein
MKQRCDNVNLERYSRYGGRGIRYVCEWASFEAFLRDMGECPDGSSLDRIDNNQGYSPENCRWVSSKKNSQNTSISKRWVVDGEAFNSLSEAADAKGVARITIRHWCDGRKRDGKIYPPKDNCWSYFLYNEGFA